MNRSVAASLLWREHEQTRKALDEARTNAAEAESQRWRAEAESQEAYWLLEDLLCAYDPDRSARPLSVAELRRWQTDTTLRFLARFREDPSDEPAARLRKGGAHVHTGRVYQVLGERDKAREAFLQAIAVYDLLVQDFPDNPRFACARATALGILAEDLYQAGRLADANVYFGRAVGAWREAVRKHPDDPEARLQLAYALCLWFDPELREPQHAVRLAQEALKLAPLVPRGWMVLGVARYRAGQWDAAVEQLQKALRSAKAKRSWDRTIALCFLAMAQWRCGRPEEAMTAYRQAVRRMEQSFLPRDVLDRAVRAEAAALLGIPEPPTPKPKEESPRKD